MENLVQLTGVLTEKGNLKQAVAKDLKDQALANLLEGFEKTPKGDYVKAVAMADHKTVYVRANLSISVADNIFDEPKPREKGEKKEAEQIEVPSIFG